MTAPLSTLSCDRPQEHVKPHTQLLRFTLGVEEMRDYFEHLQLEEPVPTTLIAFTERWFGSRSEQRVAIILRNLRARFDAYPHALRTLKTWQHLDPRVRTFICHWHTQLADPTYRTFCGEYLPERLKRGQSHVTFEQVVLWVEDYHPGEWQPSTTRQMASKLLSTAHQAGLIEGTQAKKRSILYPRVPDEALSYVMYLLREISFEGTLLLNPYLRSIGLEGLLLEDRLRLLSDVTLHRQGDLVDFDWFQPDLETWGSART